MTGVSGAVCALILVHLLFINIVKLMPSRLEYPGYEAHSGTPDDTVSYNLLLQSVREKLDELGEETGKFYGLTAALPCGTSHINNIDIETVSKYLSEFNLMSKWFSIVCTWVTVVASNSSLSLFFSCFSL